LAAPVVFYTSKSKYRGYNDIGNTIFSGSLFTFIPAIIISHWQNIITNLIGNTGNSDSAVKSVRAIIEPFLQVAVKDIASLTAWISGGVLVLGTLLVANSFYIKRRYQEQEEDKITKEIAKSRQDRRIKEVKRHAKKRARFRDMTLKPNSNKPLKHSRKTISKEEAKKIVSDPRNKTKKVSDLTNKKN